MTRENFSQIKLDDVKIEHLRDLCAREIPQDGKLKYAQDIPVRNAAQVIKILSAMTESGGDYLIGVQAQAGIPIDIPGVLLAKAGGDEPDLESWLISEVKPYIPRCQIRTIPVEDTGRHVIVVRVRRMDNGGLWALSGFLYQIVAMYSIAVAAFEKPQRSEDGEEVSAVLALHDVGDNLQAHHEWFGEDAAFTQDDQCALVQFKYSSVDKKISQSELKGIIENLNDNAKVATRNGLTVTACVLFTNREFEGPAAILWEREKRKPQSYELRYYPSELRNLIQKIKDLGREYGLFEDEIENGIQNLIGRAVIRAGDLSGAKLTSSDFYRAFTGHSSTRKLTTVTIRKQCQQQLDDFGKRVGLLSWADEPVGRDTLDEILKAIREPRALIALHGPGGCGKSVLVWQLLAQSLETCCYTLRPAEEVLSTWIRDTIHTWRGWDGFPCTDRSEEAVNRLLIANPNSARPLLWLALDGLDEGDLSADRKNHLRQLLKWFWEKDKDHVHRHLLPATLLVTYRYVQGEKDRLKSLLRMDDSEYQDLCRIFISQFTEHEVKIAARKIWPELQSTRPFVDETESEIFGDNFDRSLRSSSLLDSFPSPTDEKVIESLKHPAMWAALLKLDPISQRRAIAGDSHNLVHTFITKWFALKLEWRGDESLLRGLTNDDDYLGLLNVLTAIAHNSEGAGNRQEENWIVPSRNTDIGISRDVARHLYDEALSAGLIREDAPRKWRWQHSIVYEYLRAREQGESW